MNSNSYYLKANVVIEPLIDGWYAWSHLISPATFAMNIVGRHLKIMTSYIQAPQLHAQAVKSPKLLGGPFMDYAFDRRDEVQGLMKETLAKRARNIELAKAIKELDQMLLSEGKGFSLNPLYKKVPKILQGYVELIYDLHGNPSFRFFESLLYKSDFYDSDPQSIVLWLTNNDNRPFSLSTPKLNDDEAFRLDIPFRSELIDSLSKLKREPRPMDEIKKLFDMNHIDFPSKFQDSFFTIKAPASYEKYVGEKIRMRYFGHACILLETATFSILVDPLISYYGYQSEIARYSDEDLPDVIDYVLITHNHQDHILFETLLPLRHKIKNLVIPRTNSGKIQDPNLALMFNAIGFKNVVEIDELEAIEFHDLSITGIPFIGEHCDLDIRAKICHHVRIENFSLLFLADSCNIEPELYRHVQKEIGDVDVVFLGMECDGAPLSWLYGPLLSQNLSHDKDNSRRLSGSNYVQGRTLVEIFKPKELYVYAMGQEPWTKFISTKDYKDDSLPIVESNKIIEECRSKGITAERLYGEKELFYDKALKLTGPLFR